MPTQLVISYLRFTLATHDRQQTIPEEAINVTANGHE